MPNPRRRAVRRGAAVVTATGLALTLAGCVGAPTPTPTPTTADTPAPIFASDEEALAAAEAAYDAFLVVSAVVTGSGGIDVSGLDEVSTGQARDAQLESAHAYADEGIHSIGQRTFSTHSLQSYTDVADRGAVISLSVCDDLRGLDVVDGNGTSIVAPDRVVDVPYVVVVEGNSSDALVVSEKELWERENFCD